MPCHRFNQPVTLTLDGHGNLIVVDMDNRCIRLVSPTGHVSTLFAPQPLPPLPPAAAPQGAALCPSVNPFNVVLTSFSELIISSLRDSNFFVVHSGLLPYRRDTARCMLAMLLFAGIHTDVVLVSGDKRVAAHRSVLAARSPQFAELLFGMPADITPAEIPIPEASLAELQAFLVFLYTSEMHTPEHLFSLMDLCKRFSVQEGCLRCIHYCQRHVQPPHAVRWLVEGYRRGLGDLTSWLQKYVTQQWEAIRVAAPQTFNLMQPYPELLEATIPENMRLRRNPSKPR
eukprot:GGOE01006330.1.p1 GENE.GGOE01006330.1~~GGOE01006330.1.p1  ORF type:complete len:286 (-),score=61.75 GGOE01006330.1:788-1645(-)